jgi:small subunit ribosomal protein S3
VPLHTLRANIDFGRATAHTPYGTCGVKVWVFRGEIMEHDPMAFDKRMNEGGGGSESRGGARRDAAA